MGSPFTPENHPSEHDPPQLTGGNTNPLADSPEDLAYFTVFRDEALMYINEKLDKFPLRLIDTYLGVIRDKKQIFGDFQERKDFEDALKNAYAEDNLEGFENFICDHLKFAILSHRWQGKEPMLQDVMKAGSIYLMEPSVTVVKLQEFCCTAAKCGYRWAWSDTCCIDKAESTSEYSESINSMFAWYRNSDLTIVYFHDLVDVPRRYSNQPEETSPADTWFEQEKIKNAIHEPPMSPVSNSPNMSPAPASPAISTNTLYKFLTKPGQPPKSKAADVKVNANVLKRHLEHYFREEGHSTFPSVPPDWCKRGWTLQEMLASRCLRFYSQDWKVLAKESERTVSGRTIADYDENAAQEELRIDHREDSVWQAALNRATGVPEEALVNFKPGLLDIREKLCWASRRQTEKVEDGAYCLLGIFDLSMPVIYGEGELAFARLQEEIMKGTDDLSLFDWSGHPSYLNSCLASSPSCFREPSWQVVKQHSVEPDDGVGFFDAVFGTLDAAVSLTGSAALVLLDSVRAMIQNPPPGHSLVNGRIHISMFEYKVTKFKFHGQEPHGFLYNVEADGLRPTSIVLHSRLRKQTDTYYLCRAWDPNVHRVFKILSSVIASVPKEWFNKVKEEINEKTDGLLDELNRHNILPGSYALVDDTWEMVQPQAQDEFLMASSTSYSEDGQPEEKQNDRLQRQKQELQGFFSTSFTVYLVRHHEGRRVRVSTVDRVKGRFPKAKFGFSKSATLRTLF